MHLDKIPVETVLQVFSYLRMRDVLVFHQVSKHYDALLRENVSEVYRGIAIHHEIADSNATSIEECLSRRCRKFDWISGRGVNSWKSYGKGLLVAHAL
jgi:hypothetical protein